MGNRAKIARALTSRWTERVFFVLLLAAVALRDDAVWRVVSGAFVVWVMCALWAMAPTLRKPARGGAAAQDAAGLKTAESEHDDKKEINKE